jgi:hypothetical protein
VCDGMQPIASARDHHRDYPFLYGPVMKSRLVIALLAAVELVPEVVTWNADPRYDLSVDAMADPRVRGVQDDVS